MFEGKKTRLRSYKNEDLDILMEIMDSEILETLAKGSIFPISLDKEKSFLESSMRKDGDCFNFAIETLEKELVGGCGINSVDRKNSVAEIGIWIGKKYQGKGYASDALRVLCRFIFNELNVHKITLNYFEFNEKAAICYEKVGFIKEGVKRKEIFRYEKYHNVIYMGLFKDELK